MKRPVEPLARCEPVDNVTFSWLAEESGCVLPRGKDVPAPTPSVSAYRSLWGAGGCLSLVVWENGCLQVHQGEMTSHLSLSCSVRACSQPSILGACSFFSSCWPPECESWRQVGGHCSPCFMP